MAELSDADKEFIKELREAKERKSITRREALSVAGGVLGGGALGAVGAVETASADASTTDTDGNVGLPDDRVDVFAEGVDSVSVDTEALSDVAFVDQYSGTTLAQKLENAITANGPGTYYIPHDNNGAAWDWDKAVTVSQNFVRIVGPRVDIDYTLGSASGALLQLTGTRQYVDSLSFQPSGTQNPDYGIQLSGNGEQYVHNSFVSSAGDGFRADSSAWKYGFINCRTNACTSYGIHLTGAPNGRLEGCFAKSTSGDNIYVNNSNGIQIVNCSSDSADVHALLIDGGSRGYVVSGLTVEGGQVAGTSTDALVKIADNGTWGMYEGGFLDDGANTRRGFEFFGGNHMIVNVPPFSVDGDLIRLASTGTGRLGVQHPVVRLVGIDGNAFSYVNDATDALLYVDGAHAITKNLSGNTGRFTGDVQHDNGTNTAGAGLPCRWTGSAWQPFDGSTTFT